MFIIFRYQNVVQFYISKYGIVCVSIIPSFDKIFCRIKIFVGNDVQKIVFLYFVTCLHLPFRSPFFFLFQLVLPFLLIFRLSSFFLIRPFFNFEVFPFVYSFFPRFLLSCLLIFILFPLIFYFLFFYISTFKLLLKVNKIIQVI